LQRRRGERHLAGESSAAEVNREPVMLEQCENEAPEKEARPCKSVTDAGACDKHVQEF
jgi:hypothetical protein